MTKDDQKYYLVKLVRGPNWRPGLSLALLKLQMRHMLNLWRLRRMKKAVLASPFSDNSEIRGIVIFKTTGEDEVKALIETDPAVQAGRLTYIISPF
jgi:hypothetical protein